MLCHGNSSEGAAALQCITQRAKAAGLHITPIMPHLLAYYLKIPHRGRVMHMLFGLALKKFGCEEVTLLSRHCMFTV